MAIIGATQLDPVNVLGSYVQGMEMGRANQLAQQQQAQAEQQFQMQMADRDRELKRQQLQEKRDGYALLGQIAGTAVDQATYDQALNTLQELGVDTAKVPKAFDAKTVKTFRDQTMTEAQRLDLEIRRGTLNVQQIQARTAEAEQNRLARAAMAGPKPEKAPPGYRWTQSGDLEAIKGGPADVKGQQKESEKEGGRSEVNTQVATMRDLYNQLDEMGAITSPARGAVANIKAAAASSEGGQMVGRALGTEAQSIRNTIKQQRPLLLQAIKRATGMTAKQMDSNVELQLYLSAATDPTLDIEANLKALDNLDRLYGLGEAAPARGGPTTRGRGKPSAAPSVEDLLNKYEK